MVVLVADLLAFHHLWYERVGGELGGELTNK